VTWGVLLKFVDKSQFWLLWEKNISFSRRSKCVYESISHRLIFQWREHTEVAMEAKPWLSYSLISEMKYANAFQILRYPHISYLVRYQRNVDNERWFGKGRGRNSHNLINGTSLVFEGRVWETNSTQLIPSWEANSFSDTQQITRRFITVYTRTHHWLLSWARWLRYTIPSHLF
jgi:hypothetical protein